MGTKGEERGTCKHLRYGEYEKEDGTIIFACHDCERVFRSRAEVYSRVCGYMRPTSSWNAGKQAEFNERKTYKV